MKKVILVFSFLILISSCQNNHNKRPNYIVFEKQNVMNTYDWSLMGIDGKRMNFLTKRNQINFVICLDINNPDSLEDLKQLNELFINYNKKINFIFVSDSYQDGIKEFLKSNGYLFPVYDSYSPAPKAIDVKITPSAYLINKKGRILIENQGVTNWNSEEFRGFLDKLIKL